MKEPITPRNYKTLREALTPFAEALEAAGYSPAKGSTGGVYNMLKNVKSIHEAGKRGLDIPIMSREEAFARIETKMIRPRSIRTYEHSLREFYNWHDGHPVERKTEGPRARYKGKPQDKKLTQRQQCVWDWLMAAQADRVPVAKKPDISVNLLDRRRTGMEIRVAMEALYKPDFFGTSGEQGRNLRRDVTAMVRNGYLVKRKPRTCTVSGKKSHEWEAIELGTGLPAEEPPKAVPPRKGPTQWRLIRKTLFNWAMAYLAGSDKRLTRAILDSLETRLAEFREAMHTMVSTRIREISPEVPKIIHACSVLGLNPAERPIDMKKARSCMKYLSRQYHPDLRNSDERYKERFHQVQEAFSTLEAYAASLNTGSGDNDIKNTGSGDSDIKTN